MNMTLIGIILLIVAVLFILSALSGKGSGRASRYRGGGGSNGRSRGGTGGYNGSAYDYDDGPYDSGSDPD